MAHFGTPKSIPAHSQYLSSLCIWVCIDWRLFVIAARSSAYAAELIVSLDVPNVYPLCPRCNQRSSGSKNIRKRYRLSVSPCIVPLCIGMGLVLPKCSPVNIVLEFEYMFSIRDTASSGYPKSLVITSSLAWSRDPNAFLKSIYNR